MLEFSVSHTCSNRRVKRNMKIYSSAEFKETENICIDIRNKKHKGLFFKLLREVTYVYV